MAIRDIGVRLVVENFSTFKRQMGEYNQLLGRAEQSTQRFAERARRAGTALAILGGAVTAVGALSTRTFASFEQSMARVQAVSGATADELDNLANVARRMGETTVFTARQAAGALEFMALAGFSVEEQISALPKVLQLGAAAQLDLATSADIVTNIMRSQGFETAELARVNDALVKAFTSANTNLLQLARAFKFAGPVAKVAGIQFEETAAALALMGDAGIQASLAGTSLRGAINRLLNPVGAAKKVLDDLGVTVVNQQGTLKSLADIIDDLNAASITAQQQLQLFGLRPAAAMATLLERGGGALRQFTDDLVNAGGIAESISRIQLDTLRGSFLLVVGATESLQIAIGEQLAPVLRALSERLVPVIRAVGQWIQQHPKLTIAIFASGLVVAAFGAALFALAIILPGVIAGLSLLGGAAGISAIGFGALAIASSPITLTILAIAGAAILLITVFKKWGVVLQVIEFQIKTMLLPLNLLIRALNLIPRVLGGDFRLPNVPGFAEGGTQQRSGPAVVGERGPELVNLPAGAQVTPISRQTNFNVSAVYTNPQAPSSIRLDLEAIAFMAGT